MFTFTFTIYFPWKDFHPGGLVGAASIFNFFKEWLFVVCDLEKNDKTDFTFQEGPVYPDPDNICRFPETLTLVVECQKNFTPFLKCTRLFASSKQHNATFKSDSWTTFCWEISGYDFMREYKHNFPLEATHYTRPFIGAFRIELKFSDTSVEAYPKHRKLLEKAGLKVPSPVFFTVGSTIYEGTPWRLSLSSPVPEVRNATWKLTLGAPLSEAEAMSKAGLWAKGMLAPLLGEPRVKTSWYWSTASRAQTKVKRFHRCQLLLTDQPKDRLVSWFVKYVAPKVSPLTASMWVGPFICEIPWPVSAPFPPSTEKMETTDQIAHARLVLALDASATTLQTPEHRLLWFQSLGFTATVDAMKFSFPTTLKSVQVKKVQSKFCPLRRVQFRFFWKKTSPSSTEALRAWVRLVTELSHKLNGKVETLSEKKGRTIEFVAQIDEDSFQELQNKLFCFVETSSIKWVSKMIVEFPWPQSSTFLESWALKQLGFTSTDYQLHLTVRMTWSRQVKQTLVANPHVFLLNQGFK